MERAHIECEKIRDKHEKLIKEAERQRQLGHSPIALSPGPQQPQTIPPQTPAERAENDRLRDRLEKALQVNQLLYNFLEKHTQNQFQTRDATELEAGRLAKELEKAQMHLAKQQETNESTRIEFERMSAELNRFQERLERSEAEKEQLRQQLRMNPQQNRQQIEQAMMKLDQDAKKLTVERWVLDDKLVFKIFVLVFFFHRVGVQISKHIHTILAQLFSTWVHICIILSQSYRPSIPLSYTSFH